MGRIFQAQNHLKVVEKKECESPGCAQEGLNEEQLSGEDSRFNELEKRKAVRKEASGTMGDRRNGMFEFFDLLLLVFKPGKIKIFLINIMSLEAINNSLSFRLTQELEDRLNSWVPQQEYCCPAFVFLKWTLSQ